MVWLPNTNSLCTLWGSDTDLTKYFRVDITTALLHNTRPVFPLFASVASAVRDPGRATLPGPLLRVINGRNLLNTRFMNIMLSIGDLNALATLLRSELAKNGNAIWDDEERLGTLMNPVTHRLLNQASRSEPVTRWDFFSEALRLGAMIWIIQVKRRCRSYPGTAGAHIATLLKMMSSKSDPESIWSSLDGRVIHLWLLVICSISEPRDEDLETSTKLIVSRMKESVTVSWVEIMAEIRHMPWVDLFERPCADLGQRLLINNLSAPI